MERKKKKIPQNQNPKPVYPVNEIENTDDLANNVSDEAEVSDKKADKADVNPEKPDSGKMSKTSDMPEAKESDGDSPEKDPDSGNGEGKDPGIPPDGVGKAGGTASSQRNPDVDSSSTVNRGVGKAGAGSAYTSHGADAGTGGGIRKGLKKAGHAAGNHAKSLGEGVLTGMVGGARGIGRAFANAVTGAGSTVGHAVSAVVGKVGSGLGISKVASGILVGTITVGAVAGGGIAFANYQYEQFMLKQEYVAKDDCEEDVAAAVEIATPAEGDDQAMMDANAAKAWSVFKAMGLTDAQAAGAIGNMVGESQLSPYTMESDFLTAPEEKWYMGPKKMSYVADIAAWTENVVFPTYNGGLNYAFYRTSRHGAAAGVGLFQFTGMHYDCVEDWAAGLGTTWYDEEKAFDVQLSFAIAPTANGGYKGIGASSDWLRNWGNTPINDVDEATYAFCKNYEGISNCSDAKYQGAHRYYDMFKGTMGDTDYAQSILEMAQATAGSAAGSAVNDEADECGVEVKEYDNGDLARAAVAYAYRTKDEGRGNDGTELYQAVHRAVFPGDPWFQSCDRGVATAVRWSGADDNFPAGPCSEIIAYCDSHPDKWEYVGVGSDIQNSGQLEPGDICVYSGHVFMYVSNEIIKEKYPDADPNFDFVSASLNERSPGCGHDVADSRYRVYRLKQYETNSQYVDVVAGQNLNDR